jgi:K+-sensing histidine kinase KdpD
MAYSFYRAALENSPRWFDVYEEWFDPTRLYFALSCIFTLGNFLHSYKYSLEESARRKMRWILLGTSIAVITFVFLWQLPQLFTSTGIINEDYLLIVMAVIPLTYGFSILRYQAFDIDLIFKRSTVYGFVFLFMIAVYAVIIGGFTVIVGKLTVINSVFLSGAASIISAALIQPISNSARKFVDRKFFVVQYSYREVQSRILEKIESALNIEDMISQVINEIDNIIPLEKIFLIRLIQNQKSGYTLTTANKHDDVELEFNFIPGLIELSDTGTLPFMLENRIEKGISFRPGAGSELKKYGLAAIFPLFSQKTGLEGFLMVGRKKSGFVLSVEDISLISFACQEIAGAIEKIELRNKLIIEIEISSKLKELSELKSFFVSSVSHDLKTPLTSIKMFSEILRTGSHSAETRNEYLDIIEGESDRLTRLINNVLDFSSIEKGTKEYYYENIDLNKVVQNTLNIMQYQFKKNDFTVNRSFSTEPCIINADRDAIIEAVMNILSNAIKYSDERKVICMATKVEAGEALLTIQDLGIGIPENQISQLFEPFRRIKSSTNHHTGGTGLGLTIVKNIIDAHKGKVEVFSKINEGSTFILHFPLKKDGLVNPIPP